MMKGDVLHLQNPSMVVQNTSATFSLPRFIFCPCYFPLNPRLVNMIPTPQFRTTGKQVILALFSTLQWLKRTFYTEFRTSLSYQPREAAVFTSTSSFSLCYCFRKYPAGPGWSVRNRLKRWLPLAPSLRARSSRAFDGDTGVRSWAGSQFIWSHSLRTWTSLAGHAALLSQEQSNHLFTTWNQRKHFLHLVSPKHILNCPGLHQN